MDICVSGGSWEADTEMVVQEAFWGVGVWGKRGREPGWAERAPNHDVALKTSEPMRRGLQTQTARDGSPSAGQTWPGLMGWELLGSAWPWCESGSGS